VALVAFVVATQLAAALAARRPAPPLEWFAIASAALIVVMFLWPPYFASHYCAFFAPFLALVLALPVARLAGAAAARLARRRQAGGGPGARRLAGGGPGDPSRAGRRGGRRLAGGGLTLLVLAVAAGAAAQVSPPTRWTARVTAPAVTLRLIPRGACVLTDSTSYLLLANRFTSGVPGCSQMVDALGTDLALSGGYRPGAGAGRVPAVSAAWHQAFRRAGWVLLTSKNSLRVPWNPALLRYFDSHFRRVRHLPSYSLYARDRGTAA
jgi:hypothetical protein